MDITYVGAEKINLKGCVDKNGIVQYDAATIADMDEFHYCADGNRPVMRIFVDEMDRIWIAPFYGYGTFDENPTPQLTNGTTHRHVDEALAKEGVHLEHICLGGIAQYVVPRIATMMARCYVPKI